MSAHNDRYGWPHRRERQRWAREVEAGRVACARCKKMILPGERWDLDHADGAGPRTYLGPSHAGCNRATAGQRVTIREWADDSAPAVIREWGDNRTLRPTSRCWSPGDPGARCHECRRQGAWLCDPNTTREATT